MIDLIFPDGSKRSFEPGTTGRQVAASIAPSLAKRAVLVKLDGELLDVDRPLELGGRFEILSRESPEALETIRHDVSHILAEAVQELFPGTQVTIGPAIEDGFYYDFAREEPFSLDDLAKIEQRMKEIVDRDEKIVREVWDRDEAIAHFRSIGEEYKAQIIESIPAGEKITIYKQGQWKDLCRGPHLPSTKAAGKAFKLTKLAGAYWRGDHRNPMLQRIYGTAWGSEAELEAYLHRLEEAEKRDHRKIGKAMDLFHMQEEAKGMIFWHPKGWQLYRSVEAYMRRMLDDDGYVEVKAPQIMDREMWERSGHWQKFGKNMFVCETEEGESLAVKPMNCPGHVQIFDQGQRSYRELPLRMAEFGACHRYEPSGALHGLMRVRSFTQDDAHIFITEDQIQAECIAVHELMLSIYRDFGFDDVEVKFSDRPEKRVGSDAVWDRAEAALEAAVEAAGQQYTFNPGEGAFYGPKLEYALRDAIGREWQCGTLQVDFNLPGRLGAFYIDDHSDKVVPVMLHRAMFGSIERFTGILIEHHAGHFPLWLAPLQVVVATITSEADDYAREVAERLREGAEESAVESADVDLPLLVAHERLNADLAGARRDAPRHVHAPRFRARLLGRRARPVGRRGRSAGDHGGRLVGRRPAADDDRRRRRVIEWGTTPHPSSPSFGPGGRVWQQAINDEDE